jgi:hypothetical protein
VKCRPIAREHPQYMHANNRTRVARDVFYVGSHVPSTRQRMCFLCCGATRGYNNEKPTITDSSVGSQNSSRGVSSRKKMTVCQTVICELL